MRSHTIKEGKCVNRVVYDVTSKRSPGERSDTRDHAAPHIAALMRATNMLAVPITPA